jgi:Glycosyl transferase family 2
MARAPRVSVITPTYNCAAYLPETLGSVLDQTLGDFEIIVVDDGSTDGTRECLRPLGGRVQYVRLTHSGIPGKARNVGLEVARGEFVAFLDADDLWAPTKLERQVAIVERERDVGLCMTDHVEFGLDRDGRSALDRVRDRLDAFPRRPIDQRAYVLTGDTVFVDHLERGPLPLWTSALLVRRSCFETVGGFNEEMPLDDDTQMWLRLIKHFPLAVVDEPLARRRVRPSSITAVTGSPGGYQCTLRTLDTLDRWMLLSPREHRAVRALAARVRWGAGYHAFVVGDHPRARRLFRESLVDRPSPLAAAYLGLACLPHGLTRALRSAKHRWSQPAAARATKRS